MKITTAEPSSRHKGMKPIHLDGIYAFSIPEEIFLRLRLYEREEITEAEVLEIRDTVLRKAARDQAFRYLTACDRTEKGLLERLMRAGYDEDTAACAAADMKAVGYVDDWRYAQRFIAEQLRIKAVSRKMIRLNLQSRGVSAETADAVLAEFEQDDEETAIRGIRRKFGKYDMKDPAVEKKAISYLLHRGFSYETIRRIIDISQ
jgi:regulatory protein